MSKVRDLRKIFSCMKPYRGAFVLAALFVIVESAFEMVIPMIMADVIDVGVAAHDVNYILVQGVKMCGCALLSLITGLLYARYAAIAANGFAAELREREFAAIQTYSFSNLDHFENASLITRMTSDVNVMQNIVSTGLRPMVRGPIMLVLGIAMAFMINGELAFVFIVCAPLLGIILFLIVRKIAPMYALLQKAIDRVNAIVQENLTAIRAVKAFVRGEYEEEKFDAVNHELMQTSKNTFHYAVLNLPAFQLTMYAACIAILWFGGQLIFAGSMKVGELTGILSYVMQIMNSLMMCVRIRWLIFAMPSASCCRRTSSFPERCGKI